MAHLLEDVEEAKKEKGAIKEKRQETGQEEKAGRWQKVKLREFLEAHTPSDRLLIIDSAGNEIYRGFVGCIQYGNINGNMEIRQFGLGTDIFKKGKKGRFDFITPLGEEVKVENVSSFSFSDLSMWIYTRVVLED